MTHIAPVAQLDRAPVSGTEGHRFESCRVYCVKVQCYFSLVCLVAFDVMAAITEAGFSKTSHFISQASDYKFICEDRRISPFKKMF